MSNKEATRLSQEFELGYTYTRSLGPVVSEFYTGLSNKKLVGNKGADGKVFCPPAEFHPETAEALSEFVDLPDEGVVTAWCWVTEPNEKHPLDKPFAWAFIQILGADFPMLHALDVPDETLVRTGLPVKIRWAKETVGLMSDIVCFEPVDGATVTGETKV